MARNTRTFSDLDFNFTAHPVTGDIVRRFDESAIKNSLKNLILTSNYERPFHSEIGSPVQQLLFDPMTPFTAAIVQRSIIDLISNFEPRAVLISVDVIPSEENNSMYINIIFKIVNTERPMSLELILERTR